MTIPPVQSISFILEEARPWHLMKTVITEPRFIPLLVPHGVQIYRNATIECVLEFPEGTVIQKQCPTTAHERYLITLLDGFQLWVVHNLNVYLLFEIVKEPTAK